MISFIIYGSTPVLIVQDVPVDEIQPNPAEIRATDHGVLPMPHGTFGTEDSWRSISTGSLATVAVSSPTDLPLISASKTARSDTFVAQMN